jgi:2-polyprenyl-3-methyl-5-hydroxy-6-metoxy-1,4-benzoquinol methylase
MALSDTKHCKICGGPGKFICTTPNEHGAVKEIQNYRCLKCGLVFVANVLTDDQLNDAYSTLDSASYYSEIKKENAAKIESACLSLKGLTKGSPSMRILDIGCGNGQFLQELRDQGYESLAGHEIPGADLRHLELMDIKVYRDMDWSSVPSNAFDVITMLDVAEHVRRPVELFHQCFRMLRIGGYLYFHSPVVTKFDRMMHCVAGLPVIGKLGRIWQRGRTSIFHLQNYTDNSFLLALSRVGFAEIQIRKRNELSWPVRRYVRVYFCEKQHLPLGLAPILAPLFYPLLATDFFNSNKGIVTARKLEA